MCITYEVQNQPAPWQDHTEAVLEYSDFKSVFFLRSLLDTTFPLSPATAGSQRDLGQGPTSPFIYLGI
jgi:hypothetical protein